MAIDKHRGRGPVERKQQMRTGARITGAAAVAAIPLLIVGFVVGGIGLLVLVAIVIAAPLGYGAWQVYDAVYR